MNMNKNTRFVIALLLIAFAAPALSDPPGESGPNVTRFEGTLAAFNSDMKSGLTGVLGFDPIDACRFIFDFDSVSVKEVNIPSAPERIIQQFHGYVRASVWPIVIPPEDGFFPNWCPYFQASAPLATGIAAVNGTDNDLLAFLYEPKNENAFGWNAHGTLDDHDGYAKIFHLTFRAHWDGGTDPAEPLIEKTIVKLK